MGSQIAAEYALVGNAVHCLARHPVDARARVDAALETALRLGLRDGATAEAAAARIVASSGRRPSRSTVANACSTRARVVSGARA